MEIVPGNDSKHLTAVGGPFTQGGAPGGDQGDEKVDDAHEQAAENACLCGVHRHPAWLFHAVAAHHLDHHNAEGQPGQGIQGVVALQKAGEERLAAAGVALPGNDLGYRRDGAQQRRDHQDEQEQKEHRVQDFSNPGHDPAGLQ